MPDGTFVRPAPLPVKVPEATTFVRSAPDTMEIFVFPLFMNCVELKLVYDGFTAMTIDGDKNSSVIKRFIPKFL